MGTIIDEAKRAIEVMKRGGVILYPTDTVWGIGCDATNAEAVKRVFEIKRREDSKALLVLVDSVDRMSCYVGNVPPVAWDLLEYAEKPITLILDGARNLASNLMAADGSVGVRITSERFSKELCYRFQKPVVSSSANFSGCPTPNNYSEIDAELIASVDYVVNYRQLEKGHPKPSSIVKLTSNGTVTVIRE